MDEYYSKKLSGRRLKLCYDSAPPAVRRYLQTEIEFVNNRVGPTDRVLELGCGYGRVLRELAPKGLSLVGIDTSLDSLRLATAYLGDLGNVGLLCMNAIAPAFPEKAFDVVFCIQNGISAFHVDQRTLLTNAVNLTRRGGRVLFSSYADEFWEARLEWFRIQALHGLVGEIDELATRDGTIVCKDGFEATTVSPRKFTELSSGLGTSRTISVVGRSSVFCEIDLG
jgi:2-polyprenyl-6-hydroxyphenyl methylase/3-demethylubiquinone-9 3-methyltransferase